MGLYNSKKLLILGTSVASVDIVKYARSQGAYVYVIDYLPYEKSEAKRYADEHALISTTDVDAVYEYAKDKQVDGVFCGVSEINLQTVQTVTSKLNLPCYFTKEQWDLLQDKDKFKELCLKSGLDAPKKYPKEVYSSEDDNSIEFPVIVKPVDCAAGVGIHICSNYDELKVAIEDATDKSSSKSILVEDYVVGNEFSAAYTVVDGDYYLSIMGDKYLDTSQEGLLPLPNAYVYPSKYIDKYIETTNEKVVAMLKSIGLNNGTVFVQGIYSKGRFMIFEAGLRMGGTALYRFVNRINGISVMEMLVNYSLTGDMKIYDPKLENPYMNGKHCCLLSILNGGGTIGDIIGYEEVCNDTSVISSELRYSVGDYIAKSGTLKQSHIRFFIAEESIESLAAKIQEIEDKISVTDINGSNMLLPLFDSQKLMEA